MKKILGTILIGCSIWAETETITVMGEEIVVTAERVKTSLKDEARVVYVITGEDIKRYDTLPNLLRSLTSLGISQRGGIGKSTSFFIRGADTRHTLVMIDGVKINDPSMPGREADLSHILLEDVSQIEVIPGPTSSIYGSDGMGGLINIVTRKDKETGLAIEQGSFGRIKISGSKGGNLKALGYKTFISYLQTDGISAFSSGREKDGYKNFLTSIYLDYTLPFLKLETNIRNTKGESEYDDRWKADDLDNVEFMRNTIFSGKITYLPYNWLNERVSVSLCETKREYDEGILQKEIYTGRTKAIDWQNNIKVKNNESVFGIAYEKEEYKEINKERENRAFYLENRIRIKGLLNIGFGGRIDDTIFGSKETYQVSSLVSSNGISLRTNWQQGFKVPSLYQLYAPPLPDWWFLGGNPKLKPEESENLELGIAFEKNGILFQATHFKNDFKNLITYYTDPSSWQGTYKNIGSATTEGDEFSLSIKPNKDLSLLANYLLLTKALDNTGKRLLLRPERRLSLSLTWKLLQNLSLSGEVIYVGERIDYGNIALPEYKIFNMGWLYKISKNLTFYGRIENLFDENYEEASSYGSPGRSFYGGVRIRD